MTKAIQLDNTCLVAVLDADETLTYCSSLEELDDLMESHADAIWVYNQNPDALAIIEQIIKADGQQSIEVFQDTEGVFGLRAYCMKGKIQTPVALVLSDLQ